jgi:hypothetical protein
LKTRISEVSQSVSRKTLHNITQHSVESFQKCFDKEPLWWTFGQFRSSIKLRTLLITQTNSEWCKREFEPFANTNLGQWKGELWAVRKANFSRNFGEWSRCNLLSDHLRLKKVINWVWKRWPIETQKSDRLILKILSSWDSQKCPIEI